MKISGVYKILNTVNNKYYIGSSHDVFKDRWPQHKSNLKHQRHPNNYLQNAWNKYGEQNFICILLEETQDLKHREQWFLDNAIKEKCYNLSFIADRPEMTEKTRKLISQKSPRFGKENGMFNVRRYGKNNPNFGNHKLKGKANPSFNSKVYHFINEKTKEKFRGCLYDFYTKYNLSQSNVSSMVNKEPHRSVKGWKVII